MDEITGVLSNKWVLLAGVALGAVILYGKVSTANAATAAGANAYTYNPGFQISGAAAQLMGTQAQYAAEFGIAQVNADATKQQSYFDAVKAIDTNNALLASNLISSYAGVATAALNNSGAVTIDMQQNDARVNQAWLAADVATHGQDTALAAIRAQTAADVAKAQVSAYGGLASAKIASDGMISLANISRGQTVDVATINANTQLGISANDVTKARIAAGNSLSLTNVGAARDITLANIAASKDTTIAKIASDTQLGISNNQKKIAAKNADNGLLGGALGSVLAVLPFLL